MGKRADRINRLQKRADVLSFRIAESKCIKLDEEKAELSALEWAIKELAVAPEGGAREAIIEECAKAAEAYDWGGDDRVQDPDTHQKALAAAVRRLAMNCDGEKR